MEGNIWVNFLQQIKQDLDPATDNELTNQIYIELRRGVDAELMSDLEFELLSELKNN